MILNSKIKSKSLNIVCISLFSALLLISCSSESQEDKNEVKIDNKNYLAEIPDRYKEALIAMKFYKSNYPDSLKDVIPYFESTINEEIDRLKKN
jgi:hypothetical protein